MTPAPFLSRHFGDYLLVAQLSEDALGTVFRALYAPDERRFVRLRILQSEELPAEAFAEAIRDQGSREPLARHDSIVRRPQLDMVEGAPILAWDEIAGWTLDTMLARVRAFGIRIPAEYALLIAERIAAGLEHAHAHAPDGAPAGHGLLWPGFVAISHDASVRLGGFGIAEAVYPSLTGRRLAAEIAPYVAPEARRLGRIQPSSDVYSLGVILAELLTGRRPSLEAPEIALRAGDSRSEELEAYLHRCLAEPEQRFASAVDAHRALQQMVTGNPFSLYTANLALFLYKILNPESQNVAPMADGDSTNPIAPAAAEPAAVEAPTRAGAEPKIAPAPSAMAIAAHAAEQVPVPADAIVESNEPIDHERPAAAILEPLSVAPSAAWRRPAAALAAAAGLTVGAFLIAGQLLPHRGNLRPSPAVPARPAAVAASASSLPAAAVSTAILLPAVPAAPPASDRVNLAASRRPSVAAQAKKAIRPELRHPAEDLRLRAALARIEADRLNARDTAGDIFGEGRQSEEEGERFLRQRDYDAAQLAFSRAARLFQQAQELTWEQRLRQSSLAAQ